MLHAITLPRFYVRRVNVRDTHLVHFYVADRTTGRVVRCQGKTEAETYAATQNERAVIVAGAGRLLDVVKGGV